MIDFGRGVPGRGTFILIAIVIAIIVAVAFGYYTYSGSGINAHPNDGLDGAPGAGEPSQASGRGRTADDDDDPFSSDGSLSSNGTHGQPGRISGSVLWTQQRPTEAEPRHRPRRF